MRRSDAGNFAIWHLRLGWAGLLVYLTLGVGLEVLHGFKVSWYLDTDHSQRRMMLTLAHAHGTLFSLIQVGLGLTIQGRFVPPSRGMGLVFWGVAGGQLLLPLGFGLGGVWLQRGEPGLGVFLIPPGAASMLAGLGIFVWYVWRRGAFIETTPKADAGPERNRRGPKAGKSSSR